MGLSAGQARLLTITARKSDCEYQSMRLSHQKIALSRELADLSNEYQNSLDQTKLVYDYYGTGDTSTPLSYNILMTPSTLNDYLPTILTDSLGRVTLNSKYASAARFAGIPQEGLGTLPSETMRQAFVEGLYNSGMISSTMKDTIQGLPYNQAAGFGGDVTVANVYEDITYEELLNEYFAGISVGAELSNYHEKHFGWTGDSGITIDTTENSTVRVKKQNDDNSGTYDISQENVKKLTLKDLLTSEDHIILWIDGDDGAHITDAFHSMLANYNNLWAPIIDKIAAVLDDGTPKTEQALKFAINEFQNKILVCNKVNNNGDWRQTGDRDGGSGHENGDCRDSVYNYNGICVAQNGGGDYNSYGAIDVTNALQQFLTYYIIMYNGIAENTDENGLEKLKVSGSNTFKSENKLIDNSTIFTLKTGTSVSSADCAQATFYDALFNQICANGWTENDNVNDNEYLQEMLQNGMLYISKTQDDGYYYQRNYATDPYIKEVSDDTLIAQAEAKYSTEKAKLNSKEETLDMKMKNLDTEISSLTTEYDTVKNTISKNIEKSFKRYNA